jgi:squalene-hopene/tetraprenyl-beta-curcumene cyclase
VLSLGLLLVSWDAFLVVLSPMSRWSQNTREAKLRVLTLIFFSFLGFGAVLADDSVARLKTTNFLKVGVPAVRAKGSWNAKAAAGYLEQRETSWVGWSMAARDHGTFCISCHTAVPYALARPVLRRVLDEPGPSDNERKLIENVTKRVRLWKEVQPFYSDKEYGGRKAVESRATEAVLNALVLASRDAQNRVLSQDGRTALDNMWALQQTDGDSKGAWLWQQFDLKPWESATSQYYGAALAAAAAGTAPQNYRSAPEIQNNMKILREYLQREFGGQSTLNRAVLLWACTKVPDLLTSAQRASIIQEIFGKQQVDGGWSLFSLTKTWRDWSLSSLFGKWKRNDGTAQDLNSDGYATGFVAFTLEEAGVSREEARLQRALSWLAQNQDKAKGSWTSYSLNRRRNPTSMTGQFMSDAATAYAVLALADAQ